jgi:hypothetical protein
MLNSSMWFKNASYFRTPKSLLLVISFVFGGALKISNIKILAPKIKQDHYFLKQLRKLEMAPIEI